MTDIPPPFDEAWFRSIIGFIVGICLGSFITMLSYRAPRQLNIITPPSFCPICDTPLKAYDLVPIFSWLRTGGKCSHCNAKINIRYPLIELATGLAIAVAFIWFSFQIGLILAVAIIVTIITLITILIER